MIAFYTTLMIVAALALVMLAVHRPGGRRQAGWHLSRVILIGCTVYAAVMLMIDGAAPVFPDPADADTSSAVLIGLTPSGEPDAVSLAVS